MPFLASFRRAPYGDGPLRSQTILSRKEPVLANADTPLFRILVVDDFEPWRKQVCSMLQTNSIELRVVAEAEDGLEAVQIAKELKPDLTLLDIGLPKLDGLEAANRVRQNAPDAAITF